MKSTKIPKHELPEINEHNRVKVKTAGNVIEITHMDNMNTRQTIQRLPGDEYLNLSTGEIGKITRTENRAQNLHSLRDTFTKIRDGVNTNTFDLRKVRFITLTYKENMTDTKTLYLDFNKFIKTLQRRCVKEGWEKPMYIAVDEPQQRGAWHTHLLLIFHEEAPFIENEMVWKIWKHGFTYTKALNGIDNMGAYLTPYLADIPLDEYKIKDGEKPNIVRKEIVDDDGELREKKFVKGARLHLYPRTFNILHTSRDIAKPTEIYMTYAEAMGYVGKGIKTYEVGYLLEEGSYTNTIHKEYYNRMRVAPFSGQAAKKEVQNGD